MFSCVSTYSLYIGSKLRATHSQTSTNIMYIVYLLGVAMWKVKGRVVNYSGDFVNDTLVIGALDTEVGTGGNCSVDVGGTVERIKHNYVVAGAIV
ncbi:hypothetical protein Bca4012_044103 [Brassica carinata]